MVYTKKQLMGFIIPIIMKQRIHNPSNGTMARAIIERLYKKKVFKISKEKKTSSKNHPCDYEGSVGILCDFNDTPYAGR